ncbi:MAG: hypothetical protein H0W84_12750 [Bacteroidetes bacterium]|nr:hypothetical protein [Bacteroidota bacterium]
MENDQKYVKIIVYELLGKEGIKISDEMQIIGTHQLKFNTENLQSGIYFNKLRNTI